ncbi:RidA family protein [Solimonas sp. K1W22B-7]|uniref:RidA family protein n=1 Tax=Solimonas sp. K1W22B-7 TaxID=2303331 RepID=UPI000E335260|nr:RidA family protein [Solimonas sp. K1W22B-7]AXQ30037.1 RidA family protein [Solimonas sp. K1W22B-7]
MSIEVIGKSPTLANGMTVPLSPAVRAGNLVFVSGQLGLDDNGALVGANIAAQTHQVMARLRAVLQQAGADLDRVVKAGVWLTDKADFAAFNAIYREYFPQHPPARSTVVSELLIPGARIEIDVIASLD